MTASHFHVTGVVQGVGFRPFVYNLAVELGLRGWVRNSSEGVFCVVEGERERIEAFGRALRDDAPPMAVVERVVSEDVEPEGFAEFSILESETVEGAMTLVSPDVATCPACLSEMLDECDRRLGYPFINCTNCGPRFTIIEDIPYDRPTTTMRDFPMCEQCDAEYHDPSDRRFHAQPNACFVCGPRLYLNLANDEAADIATARRVAEGAAVADDVSWTPEAEPIPRPHREVGSERRRAEAILATAVSLLDAGLIVAIKGLGGFQLACDATNESAVSRLRVRKHRWGKPLAVMVPDIVAARELCEFTPDEEELLAGTARPIVLALLGRKGSERLAPSIAPGLSELGVMLPYTPLHHLLLSRVGRPLVMTSGNLSEEPIAMENAEALARLADIADAFLLHDRGIYSRYDDSVVRVVEKRLELVRRARGYAPFPLSLPFRSDVDIVAAGPEQKNTFCLLTRSHAFVSQHIGDMENAETLEHFESTLRLYERLFRVTPEIAAYDLHPEYLSTKLVMATSMPKIGVQHHHAHIASVTAEHGVSEKVVGVAFDGTGYGSDGHIWGGEVLVADWQGFERYAHLAEVPLPGGASAIKRPARMAIGVLAGLGRDLLEHPGADPLRSRLAEGEEDLLLRMIERGVNCPPTSSAGRLFDAVAALTGVRDDALYEGQAAIELEAIALPSTESPYRFGLEGEAPVVIDSRPVVSSILTDIASGVAAPEISARFHAAVVDAVTRVSVRAAKQAGTRFVALAGGVFMNRIVLGGVIRALEAVDLRPLVHLKLPVNDGGVSFGQAVVAWARRHEV